MKRIISKIAAGAAAEAGAEATRRGLEKLESSEERERREAKAKRRRALLILGGGAVGLVVVIGLMTKVITWLLLAGFTGAVGYGGWLLLRPRLKRLGATRKAKETERLAARDKQDAARQVESAKAEKVQALEDELEALKARKR